MAHVTRKDQTGTTRYTEPVVTAKEAATAIAAKQRSFGFEPIVKHFDDESTVVVIHPEPAGVYTWTITN